MTRRTSSLTLLAAALILLCWTMPSLAQAAPAAAAKAPVQVLPEKPLAAPPSGAEAPVGDVLAGVLMGARTCSTANAAFEPASVIIPCPYCRPGWVQCGTPPRCRCCGGL